MRDTHHVFLLPGFFGFVNFGRLVYFTHVREFLEDALAVAGLRVEIHRVSLSPTASLRTRSLQLLSFLRETAPPEAPLHLIGHSTGGLDARLLSSPNVALGDQVDVEPYARRIRSVVTVSTPHFGTPLAGFFSSIMGQRVLRVLSLVTITVLRGGRLPVALLARLGAFFTRMGVTPSGPAERLLEHLEGELLGNLDETQRDLVSRFIGDVRDDQALIPQLAPEAMELFNATTTDRPGVRYGCVIACAAPPRLVRHLTIGLKPWGHATYALYRWLYRQSGSIHERWRPRPDEQQRNLLLAQLGRLPSPTDSDAIVPTWSQLRGELLYVAQGDHLNVIGHFDDPDHQPPHYDWLRTQSSFGRKEFEALWTSVAQYIAEKTEPKP